MADDFNMLRLGKFLSDEIRKVLLTDPRFSTLTPEKLTQIVQKTVTAALAGKEGIRIRSGSGGLSGGGRLDIQIRQVMESAQKSGNFSKEIEELKRIINIVESKTRVGSQTTKRPRPVRDSDIAGEEYEELRRAKEAWDNRKLTSPGKGRRGAVEKGLGIQYSAAAKDAGLVRVKGQLFWKDEWEAHEKELEQSKPKEKTSKTGRQTKKEAPKTEQYSRDQAIADELNKNLGKAPAGLSGEKLEQYLLRQLKIAFPEITKEEVLKVYREILGKGAEEQETPKKSDFEKEKENVSRKKTTTSTGEQANATIDKEALSRLKEKVKVLFDEIGKSLHKVIPEDAANSVMKSIEKGAFNESQYLQTGAPALGFNPIQKFLQEENIKANAPRTVDLQTGKEYKLGNKELETAKKILDYEIKRETVTRTIYDNYKVAARELDKFDPRFLQDPQRKLRVLTDTSTGSDIVKASFTDELGVMKQATVVIDKYGDVVKSTVNRHASFFQGVARDVREFAKWSVAIALVYTPMQKLKELIDLSIKSQTLLADTIVTLGETQDAANKIFEAAASIAETTGESILGVIEGYNLALRAAGDAADKTERYRIANQLLTDSITLAKLSTLSQAEATDTLVAALKQTGTELDQGQVLLDKWVKVTKVANVDLTTLAVSFSIVGEAAVKAGLDVDELNGLVALMASQTGLSAKETGNAVRALISGYVSDPAVKELSKFGIAVKNLDGDAREFEDVMRDIRTSFESGLISPGQLNEIANAIGGGVRRQAQVVTSIVNMETMNRVAGESATAHGEAQRALAIELDTVATKATLLSNSFTKLAQTFGMEGGLLDGMGLMLDFITWISEGMVKLIGVFGTAGPILASSGLLAFLTKGNKGFVTNTVSSVARGLGYAAGYAGSTLQNPLQGFGVPVSRGLPRGMAGTELGKSFEAKAIVNEKKIGSAIAVFMMAGIRAAKGDWWGAGLVAGAGLLGALKGPMWAMFGATIGSAIANRVEQVANKVGRQPVTSTGITPTAEKTENEVAKTIIQSIAELKHMPEWVVAFEIAFKTATIDAAQIVGAGNKRTAEKAGIADTSWFAPAFNIQQASKETQVAIVAARQAGMTEEAIQKMLMIMASAGLEDELLQPSAYKTKTQEISESGTGIGLGGLNLGQIPKDTKLRLREEFYDPSNQMSPASYKKRAEILTGSESMITEVINALSMAERGIDVFGGKIKDSSELVNLLVATVMDGTDEQLDYISAHVSGMKDAYNKIAVLQEDARKTTDAEQKKLLLAEAAAQQVVYDEILATLPEVLLLTKGQIDLNKVNMPQVDRYPDLTKEGFDTVVKMAEVMNKELEDALTDQQKALRDANLKNLEKLIEVAPGVFEKLKGPLADLFNEAFSRAKEEGKIKEPLDLQELDISKAMFDRVNAQVAALMPELERKGYKGEDQEIVSRLDDKQWYNLTTDWKIFNILLQEILDTEKQQLEGIYNLPANGSFFVPFQARQIEPGLSGGIDTANLEAGVDNAGDRVERAIGMSAEKIANAIAAARFLEAEQIYGDKGPVQSDEDRFAELSSKGISDYLEKQNGDSWATDPRADQYKENYSQYQQDLIDMVLKAFGILKPEPDRWARDFEKNLGGSRRQQQSQQAQFLPMSGAINTSPLSNNLRDSAVSQANMAVPASQQRLNLNISSNVNLRLDGRTVANVVKRYLGESLLRYSSSSGSISRSVIV